MNSGEKINSLRKEKGVSVEELAKLLGLSNSGMYKIFGRKNIDVEQLKKLADYFGISFESLLPDSQVFNSTSGNGNVINITNNSVVTNNVEELKKEVIHLREIIRQKEEIIAHKEEVIKTKNQLIEVLTKNFEGK